MTSLSRNSFVSSILLSTLLFTSVESPVRADVDASPLLQQAMRFRVAVHTNRRSGRTIPVYHCRRAHEGCDQRLVEFAHYLIDAGERNGIDPWLLAAMAFRESGMNPFAIGGVGELGILQLHPKNPRAKTVRFVKDERYRMRCQKEAGACQREVVDRAAEILARSLELCDGDLNLALGAYNTGRCGGNKRYATRILSERDALRDAVGLGSVEKAAVSVREPRTAVSRRQ
jgi:hypothetical protein